MSSGVILVIGFEPFGGERINPSWEVARQLGGKTISSFQIETMRLPVDCMRAARGIARAITKIRPRAVLGLGQAGGRPALSIERVAINLAVARAGNEGIAPGSARPIVRGGPDAYFARVPFGKIIPALARRRIPATISLTAGAYACNAAMYSALHALRKRRGAAVGFIHLPYDPRQASRHRNAPSMSLALMTDAVTIALEAIANP
jgi:pyroglutamyl-peptidase